MLAHLAVGSDCEARRARAQAHVSVPAYLARMARVRKALAFAITAYACAIRHRMHAASTGLANNHVR